MTSVSSHRDARFVARTEPVDDAEDLLAHLGPDGFAWLDGDTGFVTRGVAARVPAPAAAALLRSVRHEFDPDSGHGEQGGHAGPARLRVVGALPFEGSGEMTLPASTVGRDQYGRTWRTTIEGVDAPAPLHVTRVAPARFTVGRTVEPPQWREMVVTALDAIERGDLEKVVLSRDVEIDADAPFDIAEVVDILRRTQPGCIAYAHEGFVGASPELLVRRHGDIVESRPMAGTGDEPAALLASQKDAHEHRVVVEAIERVLATVCTEIGSRGPAAVRFPSVTHLATTISGRLADPGVTALDLVRRLHPTPAVGGWPSERAQRAITALERRSRGRYTGACGWMDANGDGEFVVALRCAEIDGAHARLFAGAGIVAGSEPGAEWAETQAKLQPMLHALLRP